MKGHFMPWMVEIITHTHKLAAAELLQSSTGWTSNNIALTGWTSNNITLTGWTSNNIALTGWTSNNIALTSNIHTQLVGLLTANISTFQLIKMKLCTIVWNPKSKIQFIGGQNLTIPSPFSPIFKLCNVFSMGNSDHCSIWYSFTWLTV